MKSIRRSAWHRDTTVLTGTGGTLLSRPAMSAVRLLPKVSKFPDWRRPRKAQTEDQLGYVSCKDLRAWPVYCTHKCGHEQF